jgi:hypothetical protein
MNPRFARIRAWLENPDFNDASQVTEDLFAVAVDALVESISVDANSSTCLRLRLNDWLEKPAVELTETIIHRTLEWWAGNRLMDASQVEALANRCVDQLAAAFVFGNLNITEVTHQPFWLPLLKRVIWRQLLPKLRRDGRLSLNFDEDTLIAEYLSMITLRSQLFIYEGLGQAINYFAGDGFWKELCRNLQPFELEPDEDNALLQNVPDPSANPTALSDDAENPFRQRAWDGLRRATGSDETAMKFWVLHRLREDRGLDWKSTAEVVSDPILELLDDDDLPPKLTCEDVHHAFEKMAMRSRPPGRLTATALRQFYSRIVRNLPPLST